MAISDRLTRSRLVADSLIHAAKAHARRGNDETAIALASVAATVSRRRHTGCFTNADLERLLLVLSSHLPASEPPVTGRPFGDGRERASILHVMTRCYATGGHTRLVERWIAGQPNASSSLVLTSPESAEPPADLSAAVERSGGLVHRLIGSVSDRAVTLRTLACASSVIVLSIHENDIVPSLALAAAPGRPPVVVMNHADHVFWVGASLADVVVTLRPAGTSLAIRRRGIPAHRCIELPMPVSTFQRTMEVADAKQALGIARGRRLLVTVGWNYKFEPFAGRDLIAALGPVLADPDTHLIAIGPNEVDAPWASAHARYGNRVRAIGRQADTRIFLEAADIFLEAFPIASLTASLEAGLFGLPVVSLSLETPSWPATLTDDDPALTGHVFRDVVKYRERIQHLLADDAARSRVSRSLKSAIAALHGPSEWTNRLDELQEAARRLARRRVERAQRMTERPGAEDSVLATHLADAEDRQGRPELRFIPTGSDGGADAIDFITDQMHQLDSLLLGTNAPGNSEYAAALTIARSVSPWQLQARAMRRSRATKVRRTQTPHNHSTPVSSKV